MKNRPRLRRITPPRHPQPSAATLTEYAATHLLIGRSGLVCLVYLRERSRAWWRANRGVSA